jgi:hypothetical protein
MLAFIGAIIPSAGVLFIFWLGIRAMLQADRRERAAIARLPEDSPQPSEDHEKPGHR